MCSLEQFKRSKLFEQRTVNSKVVSVNMAPKLYSLPASPPCRAVLVTAKALNIELENRVLDFEDGEHLSSAFLKLNPQHTVPTLDDDGLVIWDSHAINAYLVGKYGKDDSLYPKELYQRALVDQRLHFDSSILCPLLKTVVTGFLRGEIKEVPVHMVEKIQEAYMFVEMFLKGDKWMVGDNVSIADFNAVTNVTSLDYLVKVDPKKYPNITAWLARAYSLPCFSSDREQMKPFVDYFDGLKQKV